MSFATELLADARQYVERTFNIDLTDLPAETVRGCIDKLWEGGWSAYESDFRRSYDRMVCPKSEELSPVKKMALVTHFTKRRLGEHDEILDFEKTDLSVKFVISRATVEKTSRRDKITSRSTELWSFTRSDVTERWHEEFVDYEEADNSQFVRFGSVNTPERAADQREQFETCYRPGTAGTPMQGWVARLELSHNQAHANEVFQKKG